MDTFPMIAVPHGRRAMGFTHEGVKWVTNGHWMARADYVAFNKKLREMVARVVPEASWMGNGDQQPVPEFSGVETAKRMLTLPPDLKPARWLPVQSWLGNDDFESVAFFAMEDGEEVLAVNLRYVAPFRELKPSVGGIGSYSHKAIYFLDAGELQAIVMPLADVVAPFGDMEANVLAKALAKAGFPK